jgi:hypothetical protein
MLENAAYMAGSLAGLMKYQDALPDYEALLMKYLN